MAQEKYPLEALFGRVLSPFEQFRQRTTAGGIVLIAATLIALGLATALGDDAVHHFWERRLSIGGEVRALDLSWHHWVNDGLMALFFLLVGLELKREILVGELSSLKDAALPVFAAVGGMVVPAVIYTAFNAGTASVHGWGIPMATDIAFAIGILVMLGQRIPKNLVIFLTALAIADDLGAVLVIAVFYTAHVDSRALGSAAACMLALALLNRGGVRHPLPYAILGILLWLAVLASGVHATIAGVLLALAIPARAACTVEQFEQGIEELGTAFRTDLRDPSTPSDPLRNPLLAALASTIEQRAVAAQSPLQRIEHSLSPWVTFVVIPVFALSNAGIDLATVEWSKALSNRVALGVFFGLVVGKFLGIGFFALAAVRLGWARLPSGVRWPHVFGAAWLGGIGFTMSLFIGQLAFQDAQMIEEAKLGILLASCVAAAVGLAWLLFADLHKTPHR
jgi:NhaA family Na+:H+ antiporter